MSDFTYRLPEFGKFLATLRVTLEADGKAHWSALLEGATGEFYTSTTFSHRWNAYWAELRIRVPADRLPKFNPGARAMLLDFPQKIMPTESGYDLREVSVTPVMVGSEDDEAAQLPTMDAFLHSLRLLLEKNGYGDTVPLLLEVHGAFETRRNRIHLRLRVPLDRIDSYDPIALNHITEAGRALLRSSNGGWLEATEVDPIIEAPPDDNAPRPRPTFKPASMIEHDRLFFRSKTEIRVYEALKKRNVLFFANATAVLGGKFEDGKVLLREPDFLVCQDGRWGILEPGGESFHTSAMRDHDRLRMFNDYGIRFHHFYPADRCYKSPDEVVDDFLSRLARS